MGPLCPPGSDAPKPQQRQEWCPWYYWGCRDPSLLSPGHCPQAAVPGLLSEGKAPQHRQRPSAATCWAVPLGTRAARHGTFVHLGQFQACLADAGGPRGLERMVPPASPEVSLDHKAPKTYLAALQPHTCRPLVACPQHALTVHPAVHSPSCRPHFPGRDFPGIRRS